ncbi:MULTISPECIES: hypothetical protein [Legionella]|uniref:hypothetical protein n=1 Tax=Legionella TaxID=445 RepID=UPI000F8C76FD|nr:MULTISPECIES: hypothetical protein [Legionella]MCP0913145.1 hypothetical protein [Legionella sp. 27cVA30]RUR10643.1 hypothetical protein ELY14_04830 [Legionella septentrionalis]
MIIVPDNVSLAAFRQTFWSPITGPADILLNMASPVIFPIKYALASAQYLASAITLFTVSLSNLIRSVEFAARGQTERRGFVEVGPTNYLQSAGEALRASVLSVGMALLSAILALCGPVLGLVAPVTRTVKSIVDLATEGASSQADESPTFR